VASVYSKRGVWYARVRDAAGRWVSVATAAQTKADAKRLAFDLERKAERQRHGLEALPTDSTLTLGELCEWWLEARCPPLSLERERLKLHKHVINTSLARVPLRAVTPALIEARLREMQRAKLGMATLNAVRSTLHTVYARARKAGHWGGPNPIADVERRRVPKRAYPTLRAEEVSIVLAHVPLDWRDLFATALYTGMRKGELFGLRKSDIDMDEGLITVARSYDNDTTKGGHADKLPIAPPLIPYLESALESRGALLFPGENGAMRSPEADPQKVLRHALARAAVVEGYDHICRRCKSKKRKDHTERFPDAVQRLCKLESCGAKLWPKAIPRQMRFHDLRHTTATLLLRAGVDSHRVQRILRHSDVRTTTGTYAHLEVEDLRGAMDVLAPLHEKQTSAPVSSDREAVSDAAEIDWEARESDRFSARFATRLLPDDEISKGEGREPLDFSRELAALKWSGRQDSNLRPPGPEPGALPG